MSAAGGLMPDAGRAFARQARANLMAWLGLLRRPPRGAVRPYWWRGTRGIVVATIVVAIVAAVLMVTTDVWAITMARTLPFTVRHVFGIVSDFGKSGWFLWPSAIALILICLVTTARLGHVAELVLTAIAVRLTFLFVAIGAPGLFTAIVKNMIGRARPFVGGSADAFLYHPFMWKPAYASLPSGHSTSAVAAAVAIGTLWPRSRPYVWTYAIVIMVSRVVVTAHHPSDVLAGALVGAVGAGLVCQWFATRRLALRVAPEGRIQAMPGPSWRRVKRVAARLIGQ
jgi:undecaprenyl-diphosphatase